MNAKQKAKELVDRFIDATEYNGYGQECALITVNEILKVAFYATDEIYNYYLEVKHEIEQL